MSCGCNAVATTGMQRHAFAIMCRACPEREGGQCSLNGRTTRENVLAGQCPRGTFATTSDTIEWCGTKFYGVPAPIRWAALTWLGRTILGRMPKPALPAGCGCIKPIKDWCMNQAPPAPPSPPG